MGLNFPNNKEFGSLGIYWDAKKTRSFFGCDHGGWVPCVFHKVGDPLQSLKISIYRYRCVLYYIWSKYSDLTRPHPKWWFSKENPLISGKPGLMKYYYLARLYVYIYILHMIQEGDCRLDLQFLHIQKIILRSNYSWGPWHHFASLFVLAGFDFHRPTR